MRRTLLLCALLAVAVAAISASAGRLAGTHLGEKVEKFIDTGAAVVTLKNMNEPDIKERLQPDLDRYLK